MTCKAVIFDLDGTLLDTLSDLTYAVNKTFESRGIPTCTEEQIRTYVGDGAKKLIERAMPEETPVEEVNAATAEYKKIYLDNLLRETKPYDGIPEALTWIRQQGIKTAVVSNKYYSSTIELCDIFFKGMDAVMGECEELGIRRKPAPDMLLKVMEDLGVAPEEVIYAGDSPVDIMTSASAGAKCISVAWGFSDADVLEARGAEYIALTPSDLPAVIERIISEN